MTKVTTIYYRQYNSSAFLLVSTVAAFLSNIVIIVLFSINVREYRRGNKKWPIQRNWQHRVQKTKINKAKSQHNICWIPLFTNKHKLTVNI
jgi:hypothetical protein